MTMMFQVEVFCVVTPCSVVVGYRRFGGPCTLHGVTIQKTSTFGWLVGWLVGWLNASQEYAT
jgi:hypothetical protein